VREPQRWVGFTRESRPHSIFDRMTHQLSSQFSGAVPRAYDAHLGPLLFDFSAADLARRVSKILPTGGRVLEVACGTGIATEHLSRALPPPTTIVATDLSEPMLAFAKRRRGALPGVSWQQADALALHFADASFDAVVCQYGIMFFPDKAQGLAEMVRVLRPGGHLVLNVWDALEHNRVVEIARDTIAGFFEKDGPRFLDVPFGYHAVGPIKDLLASAGLREVHANVVAESVVRPDAESPARGLVEGNPGVVEIDQRADADRETVIAAVAAALEREYGAGPLSFPLQEIVFEATKPVSAVGPKGQT
jgi:ubiquinone/menaquinone biosynthesis C-methylase UbiE